MQSKQYKYRNTNTKNTLQSVSSRLIVTTSLWPGRVCNIANYLLQIYGLPIASGCIMLTKMFMKMVPTKMFTYYEYRRTHVVDWNVHSESLVKPVLSTIRIFVTSWFIAVFPHGQVFSALGTQISRDSTCVHVDLRHMNIVILKSFWKWVDI